MQQGLSLIGVFGQVANRAGGGDRVEVADPEDSVEIVGDLALGSTVHALQHRVVSLHESTLGVGWVEFPMGSVGARRHDEGMELLTNVGAVVTGAVTLLVGLFSLATLLFDDIV